MLTDFIRLVYPKLCLQCLCDLSNQEKFLCIRCLSNLPYTQFWLHPENEMYYALRGNWHVESAFSFLYYKKKSATQRLMQKFKYEGNQEIGVFLGELFGREINKTNLFQTLDYIIPVPLHSTKELQRGFNQCYVLAKAISTEIGTTVLSSTIIRNVETKTQTKKGRFARWQNVEDIFTIKEPQKLTDKHVLLLDDVFTTGATIGSLLEKLKSIDGCKVSVATLAFAD